VVIFAHEARWGRSTHFSNTVGGFRGPGAVRIHTAVPAESARDGKSKTDCARYVSSSAAAPDASSLMRGDATPLPLSACEPARVLRE
jgi:hypothetical protein